MPCVPNTGRHKDDVSTAEEHISKEHTTAMESKQSTLDQNEDTERVFTKPAHSSKTHQKSENKIGSQGLPLNGDTNPKMALSDPMTKYTARQTLNTDPHPSHHQSQTLTSTSRPKPDQRHQQPRP